MSTIEKLGIDKLGEINGRLLDWKLSQRWIDGNRIALGEDEREQALKLAEIVEQEAIELRKLVSNADTGAPTRVELTASLLQGMRVFEVPDVNKPGEFRQFIRLPRELWRSAGACNCKHCDGKEGFWDTLAIDKGAHAKTYTVHYPELQTRF